MLPEMITSFIQQYKVKKGIYIVKLTTATPVSEELKKVGLHSNAIDLGVVDIPEGITDQQRLKLRENLLRPTSPGS